jgi:UDP:flavonoid glycosyltransferase YjiC (YdhE family)
MLDCDRMLLLSTRALEYPGFDPPEHVQVTGARLEDPEWTEAAELPPGDEPLVLVGLSSTFMDQTAAICRIAQALGKLPVRGLITTGPAIEPEMIPAPANVHVVASAPHLEILPHAAAMVTHAGHGSVVKALAAGVPMVMMPFGRDQVEIAARARYAGAGVRIRPGSSPTGIARALGKVLGEPSFREAAARAARTIAAEQNRDAAAEALEELAGTSRPQGPHTGSRAAVPGYAS